MQIFSRFTKGYCVSCYEEIRFGLIRNQNIQIVRCGLGKGSEHPSPSFQNGIRMMEDGPRF